MIYLDSSALVVKRDLTAFVAYDERLLAAAKDAGLPVTSPGSPYRVVDPAPSGAAGRYPGSLRCWPIGGKSRR